MRQVLGLLAAVLVFTNLSGISRGAVIWSKDFSSVNDWQIISDPGGGSGITSDGAQGLLFVQAQAEQAAFGPKRDTVPLVNLSAREQGSLSMSVAVKSLTSSVSYDIALDEFDAGTNYVNTIWQVFPSASTTTFSGTTNVPLGALTFSPNAAYVLPKITVHTGEGKQTVTFSRIEFAVSPRKPRP